MPCSRHLFGMSIVGDHAYIAGGDITDRYRGTDTFYKLDLNSGEV